MTYALCVLLGLGWGIPLGAGLLIWQIDKKKKACGGKSETRGAPFEQ